MNHNVPVIGQGPSREQIAKAEIMAAINSLSMGIYSHIASGYIATRDTHQAVDREHLQAMARNSQVAAEAYFEGRGLIQRQR